MRGLYLSILAVIIPFLTFAQPGNDPCASATALTVDAACTSGTTLLATTEGGETFPTCDATQTQTVWYSFVATTTSHDVNINYTSTSGCHPTSAVYTASCGGGTQVGCVDNSYPADIHNLTGLTIGNTYYIQVAYQTGGSCGNNASAGVNFCIDVDAVGGGGGGGGGTFTGTPDCLNNQTCATAYDFDADMSEPATNGVMDGDTMSVCGTDCNVGASDETYSFAGGCATSTEYQMVWYTFVADNANMDITVTTDGTFTPNVGIWNACGGIYGCYYNGTGNTVSVTGFGMTPGNTYAISVSSQADGAAGDFTICVDDYDINLLCNVDNSMSTTPPQTTSSLIPGGTWTPGTTVEFCYTVNQWDNSAAGGCQWIHGIVPSFGGCFDPSTLTSTQVPVEASGNGDGSWAWTTTPYTHNSTGATVNPDGGWFFTSTAVAGWGDGCPNNSWSMGGSTCDEGCLTATYSTYNWTACFSVQTWQTVALCNSNSLDCSASFKTYADGETGSYTNGYCLNDPAASSGNQVSCCDLTDPSLVGAINIDTSDFDATGTIFTVRLSEPLVCNNLDVADFDLMTNGWPLGGSTLTSVVGGDCTGTTDTTMSLTFTLSAPPSAGYDHSWYVQASAASDVTDVCGNTLKTATSNSVFVLPIDLLSFSGEYNGEDVDLEWSTASELNSDYFYVQSSTDGMEFTTFLVKQAMGNSTTTMYYSGVDRYPTPGIMYYRLLMVDKDGASAYSQTIAVEVPADGAAATLFPNPTNGQLNVDLDYYGKSRAKIFIFNAVGSILREKDIYLIRGTNKESIDVSSLPEGTYILEVVVGETRIHEPFIKK